MSNREQKLEQLIDRTLREQPAVRAPASLEQMVLAELARRAALPWWRKSFAYWPLAARIAFVVVGIGIAKLGVDAGMWVASGLQTSPLAGTVESGAGWLQSLSDSLGFLALIWTLLIESIPPLWLYGGVLLVMALYGTMFALSAVAYRTLYAAR
jgi:hypothetical protein